MIGTRTLDWTWVAKCRLLGGSPTLELFDEAIASGPGALPLMTEILARRELREGEPPDCVHVPVHALRVIGTLGLPGGLPAAMGVLVDPVDPGQYGEEAALALARLGEGALPPTRGVLVDPARDTWVRVSAARALMFAALRDRRLRPRILPTFEGLLASPTERDRCLLAHVVSCACLMAATVLLPAIAGAYAAGRVDEDVVDFDSVEIDLLARQQRPDPDAKCLVRRDVREDLVSWSDVADGLPPQERSRLEAELRRLDREGAAPPEPSD